MVTPPREPSRRLVFIGASNLTRAFPRILRLVSRFWEEPLDVVTALGHGRSFGMTSRVIARILPGILASRMWQALPAANPLPTHAVITDIGNDILYHAPVEQVAQWVESCLQRLKELDSTIVMTRLPVDHLPQLGKTRFLFFRSLLVPTCRLSFDEVIDRAVALDRRVCELAEQYEATIVPHQALWYGLDPMHIRRRQMTIAWREILSSWVAQHATLTSEERLRMSWLRFQSLVPDERILCGMHQRHEQPAWRFEDGSRLSIY